MQNPAPPGAHTRESDLDEARKRVRLDESIPVPAPADACKLAPAYDMGGLISMGVYRAIDCATHQAVVIKLQKPGKAAGWTTELAMNKMFADIRAGDRAHLLQCVMVARVERVRLRADLRTDPTQPADVEEFDARDVLVMDLAQCTLHKVLCGIVRSPELAGLDAAQFMRSAVCQVLCQLHALAVLFPIGFQHGDMHPRNVLLVPAAPDACVEFRVGKKLVRIPTPRFACHVADFGTSGAAYITTHPKGWLDTGLLGFSEMPPCSLHTCDDMGHFLDNMSHLLHNYGRDEWVCAMRGDIRRLDDVYKEIDRLRTALTHKDTHNGYLGSGRDILPALVAACPEMFEPYIVHDAPPATVSPAAQRYIVQLPASADESDEDEDDAGESPPAE
jgi:hypothetical protein